MNYEDTDLYFLQRDACRAFGDEEGGRIFRRTVKLWAELVCTTDYQNSPTYESQLQRLVYPVIAFYKTLLAFGYRTDAALGHVRSAAEKAAEECAERLASQMRPIFPYHAFRRNIKNFIEYRFPARGWKSEGLQTKGSLISFRIAGCFYYNITRKFGCPELCPVFCEYEARAFAGLSPQILFECGGTLANGHDFCDFRFRKGRGGRRQK